MASDILPTSMDRVTLTEFVGAPSPSAWSRVEELRVSEIDTAYVAFSVTGIEAGSIGREVVAHLRAEKPASLEALYEFLIHLNSVVQDRGGKLAFAAGFVGGGESGWITLNGSVYLLRNDKFGVITSGPNVQVKVGRMQEEDAYVLTTAGGGGLADEVKALKERGYTVSGMISTIGRLLQSHPQADQTAICLLSALPERAVLAAEVEAEEVFSPGVTPVMRTAERDVPLTEQSFKPRRLDLDDVESAVAAPASDKKRTTLKQLQRFGVLLLSGVQRSMGLIAIGLKAVVMLILSFVNALSHKIRKRPMISVTNSVDDFASKKPSLSTKKVVAMVTVGVGSIILILLLITAFVVWRRGVEDKASAFVRPFNDRYETAIQLHRLDPIRGREQLETLLAEIRTAQAESQPGSAQRKAIDALLATAEAKLNELVGADALSSVPVWLDLQDQAPGFVANKVSSQPGWLLVADTGQQKGFLIDLRQKQVQSIDLTSVPAVVATELRSNEELFTLGAGIHLVDIANSETSTLTEESDSNRAGNLISSFDNFIYVFNPESRRIYRYVDTSGDLSAPASWLTSPLGFQAEDVYDMAVDGDLWLTTRAGELKKFTSGRSTSFTISQLPDPLGGPISIVASPNQTYLYLFVPNQGRVVVLTKDGIFVKQIKSSVLAGATDVAVDEEQNQLYVVSGSVVYQVSIL